MSLYNSTTFSKLIVNGVSYNKAYMGSKTLFEQTNPFTLEMIDSGNIYIEYSNINSNYPVTIKLSYNGETISLSSTEFFNNDTYSINAGTHALLKKEKNNWQNITFDANTKIKLQVILGNTTDIYTSARYVQINASGRHKLYGDLTTLSNVLYFRNMFLCGTSSSSASYDYRNNLIDISGIIFPDYVRDYCYYQMFNGCRGISTAQDLPATTLAPKCYIRMFASTNITSLTLHATEYGSSNGNTDGAECLGIVSGTPLDSSTQGTLYLPDGHNYPASNLNYLPENWTIQKIQGIDYSKEYLTIESLSDNNSIKLLKSSSSAPTKTISYSTDKVNWSTASSLYPAAVVLSTLNTGDKLYLKGTNGAYANYSDYFNYFASTGTFNVSGNILSLIYGDDFELNTTLSITFTLCGLFSSCTNLIDASNLILPQNVVSYSYAKMFKDCTSLTTAPVLPALTLSGYSYMLMFNGCTSLNYIKMLATDISANYCLYGWVTNVSATGNFVKDQNMTTLTTGASGIPSGWTVIDVS